MEMENEKAPDDDPVPRDQLSQALGKVMIEYGQPEHDTFIDGLSLGVWDDDFGYYRPAHEVRRDDVTTTEDMKSGIW